MRNRFVLPVLAIYFVISAVIVLGTGYWARDQAETAVRERSASTLNLVVENLRGELSKFIYLPKLLSALDSIPSVLAAPTDKISLDILTEELGNIANFSGAKAIYLLDDTGRKVTSSDATLDEPSTPRDFSKQPYFLQAMQGRLGRQFGIDPESSARSYFFAHPIRRQTSIAGVVVIQVEMDNLEPPWFSADSEILVVDEHGIVFLTSRSEWRFRAISALDRPTREKLIREGRYANQSFEPLPFTEGPEKGFARLEPLTIETDTNTTTRTDFIVDDHQMPDSGWRVLILADAHGVHRQVLVSVVTAISALLILLLVAANIYQRRRRMIERMAIQETARYELETRVVERTQNLTDTNTKLRDEIDERLRAESQLKTAQAELVQASKMAALGQMSAGLSHELNQPLAAIRSYAENAGVFLDRQRPDTVRSNLKGISELTERMARIIKNLRTYSRNEQVPARPVLVQNAVQEALSLLEGRLVKSGITVRLNISDNLQPVMAGDVRLQQVFVNLFSNSIDAMDESSEKTLSVRGLADSGGVQISVHDTGPGVPEEVLENVFDPFYSTKDLGEGMGLGLSVTFGIIRRFGGVITVSNAMEGGAVFTITLPRADCEDKVAE
ncbi:MAG: ATP-binding protein [Alphaproteobacteria bacterium]|nr:ATP-binding protein [Alphaproteobacteria bacterium]